MAAKKTKKEEKSELATEPGQLEPKSEILAEDSEEKEIEEILKKRTAELKEKEEQEKEEERKLRLAEIEKRKKEGAEHTAKEKKIQIRRRPRHGKKYRRVEATIDRNRPLDLLEAVQAVKKGSIARFDASVDIHLQVLDSNVRGIVQLPHGTGRQVRVAIASPELIEEIAAGKIDFDVLVTKPDLMPKLARVAKILGPKGLMPSPKSGTISEKPEELKAEIQSGKVEYRADKDRVIHQSIGRVSWEDEKLLENLQAFLKALSSVRIKTAYLAPTMGPSVKLAVEKKI